MSTKGELLGQLRALHRGAVRAQEKMLAQKREVIADRAAYGDHIDVWHRSVEAYSECIANERFRADRISAQIELVEKHCPEEP